MLFDDFTGSSVNTSLWRPRRFTFGTKDTPFVMNPRNAKGEPHEAAYYQAANVSVADSHLIFTMTEDPATVDGDQYRYATGTASTEPAFQSLRGDYIEARIMVPPAVGSGTGLWPGFFLAPLDFWPPELDIFEFFRLERAGEEKPQLNYWYNDGVNDLETGTNGYGVTGADYRGSFHTYGCWRKSDGSMVPYVDGVAYPGDAVPAGLPQTDTAMYLVLALACYRDDTPSGTPANQIVYTQPRPGVQMRTDWVSVWRPA